jgi:beta-xylosidase
VGRSKRATGVGAVAVAVAVVVVVVVVVALIGVGRLGSASAGTAIRATSFPAIPALPRLGTVQTVDPNDVGDPFVLSVPAGIRPPSNVPFQVSGYDSYQSAPWSAATATSAFAHGWYVLLGTTDWQGNVPTAISTDLVHWTQAPDALPVLPSWAAPSISMTWAPAALRNGAGWVLYFSTEDKDNHLECIGRAVAASPAGPYVDHSATPMVCQTSLGGSIDPSVVRNRQGAEYLVWKNNGNAAAEPVSIWTEQLAADGLALRGAPHRLLSADEAWDHRIVEAPAMLQATTRGYWLFYAAGNWNSNRYGTGLAYCAAVTGPCAETSSSPFLATTTRLVSPGGLDTVTDHNGRLWAVFTALELLAAPWHPGHVYYNRVLDITPILSR